MLFEPGFVRFCREERALNQTVRTLIAVARFTGLKSEAFFAMSAYNNFAHGVTSKGT